jgi:hypothetical protein
MENSTSFDLNKAIDRWRQQQSQSGTLNRSDLDELESHLRDSVGNLESGGLAAEEAWLVAHHRFGAAEKVEQEYAKVHPARVWSHRVIWMIAGFTLIKLIFSLGQMGSQIAALAVQNFDFGDNALGFWSILAEWTVIAGLTLWIWRSGKQKDGLIQRSVDWISTHPVSAVLLCLLSVTMIQVSRSVVAKVSMSLLPPQAFGTIARWQMYAEASFYLLFFSAILIWLMRRHGAKSELAD